MSSDQHSKFRFAKRIVVAVVGGTVTLIGIALIVLPGPGIHCDSYWPFDTCDGIRLGQRILEKSARDGEARHVKIKT